MMINQYSIPFSENWKALLATLKDLKLTFKCVILLFHGTMNVRKHLMDNIDWHKLRTMNGSQQAAFEEVCCQLAACEQMALGSRFIRVGAPDAGVECYWILPRGDEHAWQAKFFTATPQKTQWREVDESVKTALEKHSRLTKYTICFPLERADPRRDKEQWFMDKWNHNVAKWKGWAQTKGMSVEFDYWGEHDMLLRLSKEEHRGRFLFWFHQELLSDYWFQGRLDEAIAGAGPRYTPALNVNLPIAHLFDGLGRTTAFFERLRVQVTAVKQIYKSLSRYHPKQQGEEPQQLAPYMQEFLGLTQFQQENVDLIDWTRLQRVVVAVYNEVNNWEEKLEQVKREQAQSTFETKQLTQQDMKSTVSASECRQLMRALRSLERSIQEDETRLTNTPALLIVGEAGTGKTHLFCDIAHHRQKQRLPTLLLLGEKFHDTEPWLQMRNLLSLSCDRDEFLGALNAAGEARKQRILILIDALNESEGKWFWTSFLAEMLITLSRYPWVGIAMSIRSSYEGAIIPEGLVPQRLIRAVHEGFTEYEYEATKIYFDYYHIERPSIPLLLPEFRNPLFLKLFCKGLQAGNYTRIPEGLQGITAVFTFFLDNLNRKLARPRELDLNPHVPYVQHAVQALIQALAKRQTNWIPNAEAHEIVNRVMPPKSYENSLFRRLIVEGVLSEDRFPEHNENGEHIRFVEGIRFAYERLSDHLIARYLLDKYLDPNDLYKAFKLGEPLGQYVSTVRTQWQHRGLIEAFSIQLPELHQKELCELLPIGANDEVIREALVESLLWRDPVSITKKTRQCIAKHALRYQETFQQFLCVLLTVAMNPRHPLNADYLHTCLIQQSMVERDAWWSTFLYNQYHDGLHSPVNRLIDWAWKAEERSFIADEPLRLAGITLCWFLTTSHRLLRDQATKALVQLLEKQLQVVRQLVATFAEVNDPYVSERLYAVAYGCAMRSTDYNVLAMLAQEVYDHVFNDDHPPSHILLRDYARGVVERALAFHLNVNVQPEKIRSPYQNTWPEEFPSEQEVEQLLGVDERKSREMSFKERGQFALEFSLMDGGDFARYVIGTNSSSHKWSARRLTDLDKPTRKEEYKHFIASLTPKQQRAVKLYREAYWQEQQNWVIGEWNQLFQENSEDEEIQNGSPLIVEMEIQVQGQESSLGEIERRLRSILGKRKIALFEQHTFSWFTEPEEAEGRLDLSLFQHWIAKRVFELGWTLDRFGEFDAFVDDQVNGGGGRSPDKPERIGKKYQWIAYYDILARATDTFVFRDDDWNDGDFPYEGPWQISTLRNLDPSFLLKNTRSDRGLLSITNNWWCTLTPDWRDELEDRQWLQSEETLMDLSSLIEVTRPSDASAWLTLRGQYLWKQPSHSKENGNGPQGKEVWYSLESCLVKQSDKQKILAWAMQHDFSEEHLPQPIDWHDDIYLGELYWSPCYQYYYAQARQYTEWTRGNKKQLPVPVTLTTEEYHWTRHYDCSIEETVSCIVPSQFLSNEMKLLWDGREGRYVAPDGELTAFDPSIEEAGPSVLLVRKEKLLHFLRDHNFALLWTVRGEKNAYGNGNWPESFKGRFTVTGACMYSEQGVLQGKLSVKDKDTSK
jgi:hypothetical protein